MSPELVMFAGGEDGQKMLIPTPSPKGELLEGASLTYLPGGSPNASSPRQYLKKGQHPEEPLSKLRSQETHLTLAKERPTAHTVPRVSPCCPGELWHLSASQRERGCRRQARGHCGSQGLCRKPRGTLQGSGILDQAPHFQGQ